MRKIFLNVQRKKVKDRFDPVDKEEQQSMSSQFDYRAVFTSRTVISKIVIPEKWHLLTLGVTTAHSWFSLLNLY